MSDYYPKDFPIHTKAAQQHWQRHTTKMLDFLQVNPNQIDYISLND